MTNGRLAAMQERAQRLIAATTPGFSNAVSNVYAIELLEAEREEYQQALAIKALQDSVIFWQTEAGRLQAKLAELTEFKQFTDAGMQTLSEDKAQKILEICGWKRDQR